MCNAAKACSSEGIACRDVSPARELAKMIERAGATCPRDRSLCRQPYDQSSQCYESVCLMMPLDWLLRRPLEVLRFLVLLGRRCPQGRP